MSETNIIGGMASPENARDFAEQNKPENSVFDIASDVKDNVNAMVSLPYNAFVRAPVHGATRVTRTALNTVFGMPWAAGHKSMKVLENAVDYPVKGSSSEHLGMSA